MSTYVCVFYIYLFLVGEGDLERKDSSFHMFLFAYSAQEKFIGDNSRGYI